MTTKDELKRERAAEAMRQYREVLKRFRVEELLWDLGCSVGPNIRKALLAELSRRGIDLDEARKIHGRGKPRP